MNSTHSLRKAYHEQWIIDEEIADKMIPLIGHLYRYRNVVSTLFGNGLVHKNGLELIELHEFVRHSLRTKIVPLDSLVILKALVRYCSHAKSMRIDLGRTFIIAEQYVINARQNLHEEDDSLRILSSFLDAELEKVIKSMTPMDGNIPMHKPCDVVLYGFGRIGRLLARLLIEKSGPGVKLMLRAIVVRKGTKEDLVKRVNLLKLDSVHGSFCGTIKLLEDANAFVANGILVQVLYSDAPNAINYEEYGIHDAVIIDNTGKWRDEEGLAMHLQAAGACKVILTAPAKDKVRELNQEIPLYDTMMIDPHNRCGSQ